MKDRSLLSHERYLYLKARRTNRILVYTVRALILVGLIALWEIAARLNWIDPFIMSSPWDIAKTIASLYTNGELLRHIGISCLETVIGFTVGTAAGTLIAIALWWSGFVSNVMEPYLVILNALPKVALGPVIIVWVGAGTGAIIVMTLAISLIVTIMEVLAAFMSTDKDKIKLVKTLGATRLQVFTKVVFPSNLPAVVNSLKVNVGLSWVGVIMGEFLVSKAGIGYLIVYGSQVFRMDLVMASVILLAAAAAVMYQGIRMLENAVKRKRN